MKLEDVGFVYPAGQRAALHEVSLTIARGEVVALVGENGSGKSTVAKLVAGLYEPTSGRVVWETDAGTTTAAEIRRRGTAVVLQEFGRYWMSAADNIGLGDVARRDDRPAIDAAARRSGADDVVASLPHGYDTVLGAEFHGGVDLSRGQWQRLALARAALRDRPLVVLDEPTASLDPRAEAALFSDVRTIYAGHAVLVVSHRFGTCRAADRIVVLHQGRVIETGTHDELVALGGRYAQLFHLQARTFTGS